MQTTPLTILLVLSYLIVCWYNIKTAYSDVRLRSSPMVGAVVIALFLLPLLSWSVSFKLLFCLFLMSNTLAVLNPKMMATKIGQLWLKYINSFTYMVIPIAFIFYLID
jgi:hypothetical protein